MNRPKLRILVGIPGSGKTTYVKEHMKENAVHLSSDTIRAELYGDESIQGDPAEVFSLMQSRAVEALNEGKDVWYDATNVTRKDRASIINICPKFAKIEAYIIWAPIEECINRDAERDRTVGKEVIDKMLKRFQAVYYDEGIDEIKVVRPERFDGIKYSESTMLAMKIPHDNPHHTLSIYHHCIEAFEEMCCYSVDNHLQMAALWHDIGKPYVKAFVDGNGNSCEYAHYYQHQCVGAWMSYGLSMTIETAWLISTHMDPFLNTKYYKNLPPYLQAQIDLLHKADKAAH